MFYLSPKVSQIDKSSFFICNLDGAYGNNNIRTFVKH